MKCIIIGAGVFSETMVQKDPGDFLICADGGYKAAVSLNLDIDLLVGDFDSLEKVPDDLPKIQVNPIKDDTDGFLAISEGLKRGYKDFILYGFLGGRIEHSIANIQHLAYLKNLNVKSIMIDGKTKIFMLKDNESYIIKKENIGYISVFSYSPKLLLSITGLKYNLDRKEITYLFPLGIDNEEIGLDGYIQIHEGLALIIETLK